MATSNTNKPAPTMWERTKGYSNTAYEKALKPGFNKAYAVVDKLGAPVNRLSNRVGAESFWPTTMDKESEKAARILRGFCKDGFYDQVDANEAKRIETRESTLGVTQEGVPQGKQRVMVKIPTKVIQQAKALAIFTTMRTGWLLGGSGGAGVIVARHPETGDWSPPSGVQIQNLSFGFLAGVDIYDTVLVINSYKALEAFTKVRCTLGTEVGVAAGPVGLGGALDSEVTKRQSPIWSYVKSRGFYAGIAVEGNLVIERTDENAVFYGYEISAQEIFAHKVRHPPKDQYQVLMDTLKAAQGDAIDESLLPDAGQAPSDMELETEGPIFGIPEQSDPDPYGVKALEAEGLVIREAGTHQRPSAETFQFNPSPSSPIYGHFSRKSVDSSTIRSRTWRDSTHSLASIDRSTQTGDNDEDTSSSIHNRRDSRQVGGPLHHSPPRKESQNVTDSPHQSHSPERTNDRRRSFDSDIDSDVEIHTATPVVAKPRVVSVPKRVPPALPPRNPQRAVSPLSETKAPNEGFEQISLNGTLDEKSTMGGGEQGLRVDTGTSAEKEIGTENEKDKDKDRDPNRLSRATSEAEDRFQSIPTTPVDEKKDIKP